MADKVILLYSLVIRGRRALAKPASGYSVRLSKTSEFEEWKGTNRKFAKSQSRMFQCSLSRRKEASFSGTGSGHGVRLSKTSKLEEWKGTNRKFAKSQSRMFQCSLSRRKRASSGEAGFRLRREVIITHFSLLVIFLYLYPLWRFKKIVIGQ